MAKKPSPEDDFERKFRELLDQIPRDGGLLRWQRLYQQVIYIMGLAILNKFENDAVGPGGVQRPSHDHGPGGGGQSGGGHPQWVVISVAQAALWIQRVGSRRRPPKTR